MTDQAKILIVEDEQAIREMIVFALSSDGFACDQARDARQADELVRAGVPDLAILDWMLPGISGLEYARRLRREKATQHLPIIMLTAKTAEHDVIQGLESGADDYMLKPFSPRELRARVRALLRRAGHSGGQDEVIRAAGLALDPVSHRVYAGQSAIELGPTEFRLLHFFMENHDRVFSRSQILDKVWGMNLVVEERTVDVHIRRLRKALESSGHADFIQTVRGEGYRFSHKP